jgi:hypothetical protein
VTLDDRNDAYWVEGADPLADKALRVRVRYVLRPDPPLWVEEAPEDSRLRRLSVVRAQGGTAFIVSPTDWEELIAFAGGWPPRADGALAELEHQLTAVAQRAQGFGLDTAQRKAVELRAMLFVSDYFTADGWTVGDVSAHRPYDLVATKGDHRRHIEVKGTTGLLPKAVLLTANEVTAARDHPDCATLAIVHAIQLTDGDSPVATGGVLKVIHPWTPREEALTVLAFRYDVPPP